MDFEEHVKQGLNPNTRKRPKKCSTDGVVGTMVPAHCPLDASKGSRECY
jgi:hypothetical protein